MKNYITFVISMLFLVIPLNAQNIVTISPRTKTINIGESAQFSVTLAVQPGFDASVFLSMDCSLAPNATSISPSIINYPYNTPSVLSFSTQTHFKKGTYTIYIYATIGDTKIYDSCVVDVLNPTPWRIFNTIQSFMRPTFITLDNDGKIYYSVLYNLADNIKPKIWVTNITNPVFSVDFDTPTLKTPVEATYGMVIGKDSTKYFFTQKGVYKTKNGNVTIYNKSNSGLQNDTVKRGVFDVEGRLWLGTPNGLASLENYSITQYDSTNTNSILGNEKVSALASGNDGRLWIGTPNGIVVKDGNNWKRYTPQNSGLPAPYIFGLVTDEIGNIWMGSGNKSADPAPFNRPGFNDCPESMVGLVKYDGINWTLFNSTNSPLLSNYVNGLTLDKKGNLWIGTSPNIYSASNMIVGCGLLKYDGVNWTTFNTSNSLLPDNNVQWVGADYTGNIWFVCKEKFGVMNEEGIPFLVNDVEEQPTTTDHITITPNPSSTTITINGTDNISAVTIVNSFGMEVVGKQTISSANGSLNVDVSDLASGIYFVQLRTPAGMISKPIVVMH